MRADSSIDQIKRIAEGIRCRALEHTLQNNGGYLSQACSSAEILAVLYSAVMKLGKAAHPIVPGRFSAVPGRDNPRYLRGDFYNGPKAAHLDRFFLSPTHYSLVLYAALVETARMAAQGLSDFNKDGSIVEMIGAEHSPGMEIMTGSLGQGISQAAGIALARKLKKETGRVWVLMSDGELQIGQVWEAVQAMSFYHLDNMGIYVDVNGYQCDGTTAKVMNIEPIEERFAAFGARTVRVNGHDIEALVRAGRLVRKKRPLVVICDTCPWQGIELLKNRAPRFHYIRFTDAQERQKAVSLLSAMKEKLRKL
ncbi:MAG: thiamine pyrophosphate-dependent enzyme [Candidatus Omnitrophota bacterium]